MRYLLLLLICCSFFWEDEEKEIKSLAKEAELALHEDNFVAAKSAYSALFKKLDGERSFLSWTSYIDYHLHYVHVLEALDEPDEAQKILDLLLSQRPPHEMLAKVHLAQARLTSTHRSPEKSFLEMSKIAAFLPMDKWSKTDLSFYHALCYSLDEHFDTLLQKARRLFVTQYYQEAKEIYEEILAAITGNYFPKASLNPQILEKKVRYCLAECHYSLAEYEQTLLLINDKGDGEIDREMIYLMALCYQKQQEYEQAIQCFQQYAGQPGQHFDHALFELGFYAYKHGNFEKAKTYFQQLQALKMCGKPKFVGALYLGRILLQEHAPDEVEDLLGRFSPETMKDDPLKYEFYYLLGEAAFEKGHYERAQKMYIASLPKTIGCKWGLQARIKLGWCYIKLEEFDKGEEVFKTLLLSDEHINATFALAHLYLAKADSGVEQAVEDLFAGKQYTIEKEHEALLLRAEATSNYEKKRHLYLDATSQVYQELDTYLDAWYKLGLSEFQKGLQNPESGSLFFERATLAFERAFPLCENKQLASEILKLEAKANFYRNSPISSLVLLEQLLEQFINTCPEHEETLYLRGLVASKLRSDPTYFALAEQSLKQVIELYPSGTYITDALCTLGTLYYQNSDYENAHQLFLDLASTYPHSLQAADALFWAAESLEKINDEEPQISVLRKQVYTTYPLSKYAAEAFFKLYPYNDYIDGDQYALAHLKQFTSFFPNSPIAVTANYLVAIHEPNFEKAEQGFLNAIHQFHRSVDEGKNPDLSTIHFYYEAQHKLALLYLKQQQEKKAITLLKRISVDFEENNHPLTSLIENNKLYDQSQYSLAKGYLQLGQKTKAEQLFLSMLKRFRERSEEVGLYLSLTWKEQGKLAMECFDLETALRCFTFADDAGVYFLSDEQKLNLWLLKSECYKKQKDFSNSMRMLSKVINADVTSPLRIKAMYLRAELYELQDRPELVVRQLEAISKKGGQWAIVAREKLRIDYGIQ